MYSSTGIYLLISAISILPTHSFDTNVDYNYKYSYHTIIKSLHNKTTSTISSFQGSISLNKILIGHKSLLNLKLQNVQFNNSGEWKDLEEPTNRKFMLITDNDHGWIHSLMHNCNDVFWINMVKGIASLMRFRSDDSTTSMVDTDTSGYCQVHQVKSGDKDIIKRKTDCENTELGIEQESLLPVLQVKKISHRNGKIKFTSDGSIQFSEFSEIHSLSPSVHSNFGIQIISFQSMEFTSSQKSKKESPLYSTLSSYLQSNKMDHFHETLLSSSSEYEQQNKHEDEVIVKSFLTKFATYFSETSTSRHAFAVLQGLKHVRSVASETSLSNILNLDQFSSIRLELLELYISCQTKVCWSAAWKYFMNHLDYFSVEKIHRLLFATSQSRETNHHNLNLFIKVYKSLSLNKKLDKYVMYSMLHTLTSLFKLNTLNPELYSGSIKFNIAGELNHIMSRCSNEDDECILAVLSAMKNYPQIEYLSDVTKIIRDKYSVVVKGVAVQVYGVISSLKSQMNDEGMEYLCKLVNNVNMDAAIRQSALSELHLRDVNCYLENITRSNVDLLKSGGYSNPYLATHPSSSSYYQGRINDQIQYRLSMLSGSGGIVRRTEFAVSWNSSDLFNVQLYADGVANLLESDEDSGSSSGGLQFQLLGVSSRPLRFFTGQSELMTVAWSAPSDPTSIISGQFLLHGFKTRLHLQTGVIVDISLQGVASLDISGSISISLWNRNAKSTVATSFGVALSLTADVRSSRYSITTANYLETDLQLDFDTIVQFANSPMMQCVMMSYPKTAVAMTKQSSQQPGNIKHYHRQELDVEGISYPFGATNDRICKSVS